MFSKSISFAILNLFWNDIKNSWRQSSGAGNGGEICPFRISSIMFKCDPVNRLVPFENKMSIQLSLQSKLYARPFDIIGNAMDLSENNQIF